MKQQQPGPSSANFLLTSAIQTFPANSAGEARGKSLLGKDEPAIWYEAAAGLEPLPQPPPAAAATGKAAKGAAAAAGELDFAAADAIRTKAEGLLEREAALFEKEMAGRNAADARWLAQVMLLCHVMKCY
jgi:hypothetical protein